jgi:integrase
MAAKLEKELFTERAEITWETFLHAYETGSLFGLAPATLGMAMSAIRSAVEVLKPKNPDAITTEKLSILAAKWRADGLPESTIRCNLGHLKAAMNWAHDQGWRNHRCRIPSIRRATKTGAHAPYNSRPLTPKEFGRMLKAVPNAVIKGVRNWRLLMLGMWLIGLRLDEALRLSWFKGDNIYVTREGSDRIYLMIHSEDATNAPNRTFPITPDAERFLLRLEPKEGLVFPIPKLKGEGLVSNMNYVSRVISDIGVLSGVVVNERTGKHASAHELRHTFGERWASMPGVTPQDLMALMRHSSIDTTLRYYALKNAKGVSNTRGDIFGSISGGTSNAGNPLRDVRPMPE